MVAFFDNIGYIAPVIGVVVFFVVIMVVRKLMAGTPDTKEKAKKSEDEDEKKDPDDEKKDSKDEDEKKDPEEIEKAYEKALNDEAGVVHELETEEKREHDEEGFEEARVGEVAKEIQDETAAISEEASAEKTHNAAAEKNAMEHEKKAVGTLEKDLQAIARQLKQYVGDEQKLSGDFEIAIEKLRKLNQNMIKIELSVTPDNAEANNKDRIGDILSLEKKTKATEQSSEQIINAIEAEINRVRTDIQGVKSSYSQQAHETLKNDLSTLKLSLGTEFQTITELRAENDKEHEDIELMFEESVKGLDELKRKISEKAAEEKRKLVEGEKRLAEEARTAEEEERKIEAEIEKAKREAEAEKMSGEVKVLEEEKVRKLEEFALEHKAIDKERDEMNKKVADYSKPDPKENRPDDFESMLDSIIEIGSKRSKLWERERVIIGDIDSKITDLKIRRSDQVVNIAQQSGITPFSNQQAVNIQGGTTIIHKGKILKI